MTTKELIERGIALAQEHASHFPIQLEATVIHPSEPITGSLKAVHGDRALLAWPDGQERYFPLAEVCEANLVLLYAQRLKFGMACDPALRLEEHERHPIRLGHL